jgi:hypothetical protein
MLRQVSPREKQCAGEGSGLKRFKTFCSRGTLCRKLLTSRGGTPEANSQRAAIRLQLLSWLPTEGGSRCPIAIFLPTYRAGTARSTRTTFCRPTFKDTHARQKHAARVPVWKIQRTTGRRNHAGRHLPAQGFCRIRNTLVDVMVQPVAPLSKPGLVTRLLPPMGPTNTSSRYIVPAALL